MKDVKERERLDEDEKIESFEVLLVKKMNKKHLSREEAMEDIIRTSAKTRKSVNERYGIV